MEWPVAAVPFADIIVGDDEESGEIHRSTAPAVDTAGNCDGTTATHASEHHVRFATTATQNVDDLAAPPPPPPPRRRFSLRPTLPPLTVTTSACPSSTAADMNLDATTREIDGQQANAMPPPRRRTLRLTVVPNDAATAQAAEPVVEAERQEAPTRRGRKRAAVAAAAVDDGASLARPTKVSATTTGTTIATPSVTAGVSAAPLRVAAPLPLPTVSAEEQAAERRRCQCVAARPSSPSACVTWWMYLCYYDVHALFTSLTLFETTLRPLAEKSKSVCAFFAAMTACFAEWRHANWEELVVLKKASADGGSVRRPSASTSRLVRDPVRLNYANAVWYEALRVQRLMTQLLLLHSEAYINSRSATVNDGEQAEDEEVHPSVWWFPEACPAAFHAALGELWSLSSSSSSLRRPYHISPGPNAPTGTAGTTALAKVVLAAAENYKKTEPCLLSSALGVVVPTARRVLTLLRIVDVLWSTEPTSLPFRLPVSEMEAPSYYRSTKDPMSLAQLYEDVCHGMTAASLCTCQRHSMQRSSKVHAALADGVNVRGVAEDVSACFIDYAHVRERLTTLKSNCDAYNGAGSGVGRQAHQLVSAGVNVLRDAAAAEDGRAAFTISQEPPSMQQQQPDVLAPLDMETLAHTLFPASEASAVVPPALRTASVVVSDVPLQQQLQQQQRATAHGSKAGMSRRVLKLSAAPAAAGELVRCTACDATHQLTARPDPMPSGWTCAHIGLTCAAAAAPTTTTTEMARQRGRRKRGKVEEGAVSAKTRGRKRKSTDAVSTTTTTTTTITAPRTADFGNDGDDGGVTSDGGTPLALLFPAQPDALAKKKMVATATAAVARRKHGQPRLLRADAKRPARTPASSTSSDASSSDSDSETSSSSSSSASSSGDEDSVGDTATAPTPTALAGEEREAKKRRRSDSQVHTHALPSRTSSAAAVAARAGSAVAVSKKEGDEVLAQLERAVAALELRALSDNPFGQLDEVRRLEKQLDALRGKGVKG